MDARRHNPTTATQTPCASARTAARWRCLAAVALFAALPGCQLTQRLGPVPKSLVASRQLSSRGVSAIERQDWTEAEQLLAQAVKTCPVDPQARRYYAEALWHRGERGEALVQMEEALRLSSDDPKLLLAAAHMQAEQGALEPALARVERALDLDPHSAEGWALRGKLMNDAGLSRRALADYQKALGYDPRNREVLLATAELYRQLNEPQRALANLQTLVDLEPDGSDRQQPLYLMGLAYTAMARYDEAAESLREALRLGDPKPEILYQLAEVEMRAGHPAAAQAATAQLLAIDPGHAAGRELSARAEVALRPATGRY